MFTKVFAVTAIPLQVALLLPSLVTEREITSSLSSTATPKLSNNSFCSAGTLNRPLAISLSLPLRTRPLSLFPPKIRLRAVKIMVFPAPVSPERTVSPWENSMVAWSMTPIERIVISSKKVLSLTAPSLNWKFELCNQPITKKRIAQVCQFNRSGIFRDMHLIANHKIKLTQRICG